MIKKILFLLSIQLFIVVSLQSMELADRQESLKTVRQKFCKAAAENDLEALTHMHHQHYDWNNHPDLEGIIAHGAAHDVCKSHYAALYNAVMCGTYEATKFLLKTDGIKISLSHDPKKLLHIVCFGRWHEDEEKQKEIVERMLCQSNVNRCIEKDDNSTMEGTPLDVAVHSSAPECIQKLLFMNGAKHALKNQPMAHEKPTLSHLGIMYEPYDESTDERYSKEDMLATTNQFAKIKEQIDSDAIVDVATDKKVVRKEKLDELLLSAVSYSHTACWVDELLKRGANIMARNYSGDTPLHKAIERGCRPCVQIILEYAQENNIDRKPLVAAKNSYNFTPLHLVAKQLLINESALLLECGAYVNARGGQKNNVTPLDCVLIGGARSIINRSRLLEMIKLLCQKYSAQILPYQVAMIKEIDPRLTRNEYEKGKVIQAQELLKDLFSKQL